MEGLVEDGLVDGAFNGTAAETDSFVDVDDVGNSKDALALLLDARAGQVENSRLDGTIGAATVTDVPLGGGRAVTETGLGEAATCDAVDGPDVTFVTTFELSAGALDISIKEDRVSRVACVLLSPGSDVEVGVGGGLPIIRCMKGSFR